MLEKSSGKIDDESGMKMNVVNLPDSLTSKPIKSGRVWTTDPSTPQRQWRQCEHLSLHASQNGGYLVISHDRLLLQDNRYIKLRGSVITQLDDQTIQITPDKVNPKPFSFRLKSEHEASDWLEILKSTAREENVSGLIPELKPAFIPPKISVNNRFLDFYNNSDLHGPGALNNLKSTLSKSDEHLHFKDKGERRHSKLDSIFHFDLKPAKSETSLSLDERFCSLNIPSTTSLRKHRISLPTLLETPTIPNICEEDSDDNGLVSPAMSESTLGSDETIQSHQAGMLNFPALKHHRVSLPTLLEDGETEFLPIPEKWQDRRRRGSTPGDLQKHTTNALNALQQ